MPNKYSHSVVLAHYSSLGLIDLPNDQYIAYLKTCPTSRRTSTTSGSRADGAGTHGSHTPSSDYSTRRRYLAEHPPASRSLTSRTEYRSNSGRDVIIESDEGSAEEGVALHTRLDSIRHDQKPQRAESQQTKAQTKRPPSSVSTSARRASSPTSDRSSPRPVADRASLPHAPTRSPPSVINLNQFEGAPAQSEPTTSTSWGLKRDHISGQVRPANANAKTSPSTTETRVCTLNPHEDLNFDGFSDRHLSELTITAPSQTLNTSQSPNVPRSQFSIAPSHGQRFSSSSTARASPSKRVHSTPGVDRNAPRQIQLQPLRNASYDSISSINSDDMVHLTTALPPMVPTHPQKKPYPEPAKICPPSRDPEINDDAIDPKFFETLRSGPGTSATSPPRPRNEALGAYPSTSSNWSSLQSSRQSSADSIENTPPNPEFWRGLEEMLSDSDSAVPPDIVKRKPRHDNAPATTTVDESFRNGTADQESKRPMTAPAQRITSPEIPHKENVLSKGRSKITQRGDVEKSGNIRPVDTPSQKQPKKGFLRKLTKKNQSERRP